MFFYLDGVPRPEYSASILISRVCIIETIRLCRSEVWPIYTGKFPFFGVFHLFLLIIYPASPFLLSALYVTLCITFFLSMASLFPLKTPLEKLNFMLYKYLSSWGGKAGIPSAASPPESRQNISPSCTAAA